jgi:Cytochrome P460
MQQSSLLKAIALSAILFLSVIGSARSEAPALAPNGIDLPNDYQSWQILGISHRSDKNSLRIILANPVAAKAASEGRNNPWPDGSMIAKLAWKDSTHPQFPAATVPGDLSHVEIMVRDSKKYAETQGWGYARWLGMAQKPYGENADFGKECAACHLQAKETGYVFTRKAQLPSYGR